MFSQQGPREEGRRGAHQWQGVGVEVSNGTGPRDLSQK